VSADNRQHKAPPGQWGPLLQERGLGDNSVAHY